MKCTEVGKQDGQWRMDQEIGSGAFGIVTLWKNQVTHEKLVIKQCKHKLDSKSHERWLEEIALMSKMCHDNLVSGRQIPKEIVNMTSNPEELLGLEFCDNDLRKVLSCPLHCCGLKEKNVLNMLRDVSSGLRFLHEDMQIIHRDLKPENILLCHRDNETMYKITDLGYAKRIDVNSICMSFVGTLQYLAPELYDHESGYTYTADYWSFGTVMFECITGVRPFLLTEKAFDWYKCIQGKKDDQIWGCFEENVGTKFHTELPKPNHLCEPVLSAFKDWFQLVLRQNPRKRGKNVDGVSECFSRAESILQLKIIHVFDMLSCKDIAYDIQPGQIGSNLKFFLEEQLNFPKEEQLLIFAASGKVLEDGHLLLQEETRKDQICLFSKNKHAMYAFNATLPQKVREILSSPGELFSYSKLKKAYSHSLFHCRSVVWKFKYLLRGLRALMISMKTRNRSLQCFKEELTKTSMKLETIIDVYCKSCNADVDYLKQSKNVDADLFIKEWDPRLKEIQVFSRFTDIKEYMKEIRAIKEKCAAIEKCPIVGIQQSETELDELAKQAEMLYTRLRGSEKDLTNKLLNSNSMIDVVRSCMNNTESLFNMFSGHLTDVMKCYDEIGSLNSSIEKKISGVKEKYTFIMERQLYRQGSLWRRLSKKELPPLPSLQSDSNLLSSLQGEFMEDKKAISVDGYSEKMINDMSINFERLRKLTNDEAESKETSKVGLPSPSNRMLTSSLSSSTGSSEQRNCSSISSIHGTRTRPPSLGYPSNLQQSFSITNERLLSYNNNSNINSNNNPHLRHPPPYLKVNERRDRCDVRHMNAPGAEQFGPRSLFIADIPPSRRRETAVFSPSPASICFESTNQPRMIGGGTYREAACNSLQYFDPSSHPPNQSATYRHRNSDFQAGFTGHNNLPRPAQGRCFVNAMRAPVDFNESRNSQGGRCHESVASYNLRVLTNTQLSQNPDAVHADSYLPKKQ